MTLTYFRITKLINNDKKKISHFQIIRLPMTIHNIPSNARQSIGETPHATSFSLILGINPVPTTKAQTITAKRGVKKAPKITRLAIPPAKPATILLCPAFFTKYQSTPMPINAPIKKGTSSDQKLSGCVYQTIPLKMSAATKAPRIPPMNTDAAASKSNHSNKIRTTKAKARPPF
ncbi:hypothetical protein HMPREF0322_01577 [Desulfitobacterium hafniense DP7]|uniref:Uncharacterized protein n=1 Tax=Desulfitobacterium hafniense DP7 TaxID=537010 RepID=G9XKW6_DESHA|nr:hypothetical protein HMPREF0322_01577 [Desulfitobacterium hafniense DP7]